MGAHEGMTRFYKTDKEHIFRAVFNGIMQFDRYVCELTIVDDKVASKKDFFAD